ncbi:MAG: hypothetical protein E7176_03180 [Erysipelotrichaceae bacterium]|nr:hypothetical protein [Erysipelotrichaceae bacterium]
MAIVETRENEIIDLLQTHYFKASYTQIKELYLGVLEKLKHSVLSINDDFGEVFSEVPHMTCTAKIIMQNPKETSIDFYIDSTYLFGSTNKAYKFIKTIYTEIEKKYELKGLSLHK